ncbi:MAG TPA: heparan-alpha-glucosaminide N-acetyltransferase domain-containing protein [archaeon]|nr:heparan-alpha-glucosaminide N-acetyltransferase domain-containing protein [archaeon]
MNRLWELDALRGTSLVLMLAFNWSVTLDYFQVFSVFQGSWLYWQLFPRLVAGAFLFIAGTSLSLSFDRFKARNPGNWKPLLAGKYLKRGAGIFSLGLAVSLATWQFFPREFVFFGILHLIGASIALSVPFLERRSLAVPAALLFFALAPLLQGLPANDYFLASLGFGFSGASLDYFPLVPWTGVVLLGLGLGGRALKLLEFKAVPGALERSFALLGRNSLMVYLLHQPLLLLLLLVVGVTGVRAVFGFPS